MFFTQTFFFLSVRQRKPWRICHFWQVGHAFRNISSWRIKKKHCVTFRRRNFAETCRVNNLNKCMSVIKEYFNKCWLPLLFLRLTVKMLFERLLEMYLIVVSPFSRSTLAPRGQCSEPCGLSRCTERTHTSDPSCRRAPGASRAWDTSCPPCWPPAPWACA